MYKCTDYNNFDTRVPLRNQVTLKVLQLIKFESVFIFVYNLYQMCKFHQHFIFLYTTPLLCYKKLDR